ncbi:MAG TPA: 50S ribosomal protein L32 [Melioribacteraceae bacterium]|nr:50S ribosomal protein L32 [Melioribacteraceae bacterium]
MPNPKRRMSKSRRDKRRANYKASAPTLGKCTNCGELKLSHRACPSCGHYAGKSMFVPEA